LKEMDCITCHNRITHLVKAPADTVNDLIARGVISSRIPEIRRIAVEVYGAPYESTEMGLNRIAGLDSFYQTYYPDFYAANGEAVGTAIKALQDIYRQSVFPHQKSDWQTHPNNIGHKNSPGCFRCHDGKHLNADQQAIRLECNLCHSIPVVAGPSDFVSDIEISRGPEPASHKNANWIGLHNSAIDQTCTNCHTTENAGGTDNTSFCSNSACHGSVWEYAGFDAPGLREILLAQLPPTPTPAAIPTAGALNYQATIGPLFQARCGACHGPTGSLQGLNLTTYAGVITGGSSGTALVPGDPEGSLLVQKQKGDQPHFGQLTPDELELVILWINAGALEK